MADQRFLMFLHKHRSEQAWSCLHAWSLDGVVDLRKLIGIAGITCADVNFRDADIDALLARDVVSKREDQYCVRNVYAEVP